MRRLIDQVLASHLGDIQDWLSPQLLKSVTSIDLAAALRYLHRPPPDCELAALAAFATPQQKRLALEELLAHRLSMRRVRIRRERLGAPPLHVSHDALDEFCRQLPFPLTQAQRKVMGQVAADLSADRPMLRLVQGDVGCGKTVVAAAAAFAAARNGYQVALMAPTELLCEQHVATFSAWLAPLGITLAQHSASVKPDLRRGTVADPAPYPL